METYAEIIAALKIRTANRKGRHISTARAIKLLEDDGVETPDGLVRAPPGLLKRATVDRLLRVCAPRLYARHPPGGRRPLPGTALQRTVALRREPIRPERRFRSRKGAAGQS